MTRLCSKVETNIKTFVLDAAAAAAAATRGQWFPCCWCLKPLKHASLLLTGKGGREWGWVVGLRTGWGWGTYHTTDCLLVTFKESEGACLLSV